MIKLNGNEISSIFYNGNEIVKAYYNNPVVYEKIKGMFITGTVSNTTYVPRVYMNSSVRSGSSPNGGTWVDTVLEGNTWKVDLNDRLPLTGMAFMFYIASSSSDRNRYINKIVFPSNIDTSNVTSMYRMFYSGSTSYTSLASIEGLENFDTSNVANMDSMFYRCDKLTDLSSIQNWNVGAVTDMRSMFSNCSSLATLDLSSWDTSNVTIMTQVFTNCSSLTSVGDLSNWDVSNVANMQSMFGGCYKLLAIGDLSSWDTSKVTNMQSMFQGCENITTVGDISGWDTSKVTNMQSMFSDCRKLTYIDFVDGWDTSKVTNMQSMFNQNYAITSINISNWDTSKVTSMYGMFQYCNKAESIEGLSNWNTGAVTTMSIMFSDCIKLTTLNLPPIGDGTKSVSTVNMFNQCAKLSNITASGPIYNTVSFAPCPLTKDSARVVLEALQSPYSGAQTLTFSTTTVNLVNQDETFYDLVAEKKALGWTINLDPPAPKEDIIITGSRNSSALPELYIGGVFDETADYPVGGEWVQAEEDGETGWKFNVSKTPLSGGAYTFYNIHYTGKNANITKINIPENIDLSNVDSFGCFFYSHTYNESLEEIVGLDKIDTSHITDMNGMFRGLTALTSVGDLSNWNTSNVTDMGVMFETCGLPSYDFVSNWDVSKVTRMSWMFRMCFENSPSPSLDLSNWDTGNVRNMRVMFASNENLTSVGDISNWNVSNVTDMTQMFGYSGFITLDLSKWDTRNVTDMQLLFGGCENLTTLGVPSIGDGTRYVNTDSMFRECPALTTITASGDIHNSVSFSDSPLTIDSVKVVLRALSTPYNGAQTITFKTGTMAQILADPEAQQLAQEKTALGWTIS